MRSRAALLPHPADPFLFKYWLKFYQNVWGDEVDKLYVLVNSPIEPHIIDYMQSLVKDDPRIHFEYINTQIEHGQAIDLLLTSCQEEYIVLLEDDGFIFGRGIVDECFGILERGEADVVGSPRGSCSMEIWEAARDKFNLNYEGVGDVGPNLWPNFLFAKKQTLLDTDRQFGARSWKQGEMIEALDYVVKDEVCPSDTFVNTSLQLRAKGLRIHTIPQYHGSPQDLEHFDDQKFLFDGKAKWVHVGSLSSGVHGVLIDSQGRALGKRLITEPMEKPRVPAECNSDGERDEWERRVAFWQLFLENADPMSIPTFRLMYSDAIDRVIQQFMLHTKTIERRKMIYHTLGL